jgi:hypothetical protein
MGDQNSGWSEGDHGTYPGLFVNDMTHGLTGGLVTDMPALGRPVYTPPPIRGLPGATADPDEDYLPGGGEWKDATRK